MSTNTICIHSKKTYKVTVESKIKRGIPQVQISGTASRGIKDCIPRIRSSLEACGWKFPLANITIHLSPQNIPKSGNQYDLPIAVSLLKAMGELNELNLDENVLLLGELDLNGNLLPIYNLLDLIDSDFRNNQSIVLPTKNYNEGVLFKNNQISYIESLGDLKYPNRIRFIPESSDQIYSNNHNNSSRPPLKNEYINLYSEQIPIFEAIEIALSGRHHILITGTPGSGKTMLGELSKDLQSIPLEEEIIEITKYNPTKMSSLLFPERPFRNPHHSLTMTSLIGGGNQMEPGEISRANNGILFLDEIGEINSKILQSLREPLEKKYYSITRNCKQILLEADFQFIGTSNLCPCGQFSNHGIRCVCKKDNVRAYLSKLTGPLLDRIPIVLEVKKSSSIASTTKKFSLLETRNRINDTIQLQKSRNFDLSHSEIFYNSDITEGMWDILGWTEDDIKLWDQFVLNHKIGNRQRNQILGVSRTIADINRKSKVEESFLYAAMSLREGSKIILSIVS